MSSQISTQKWTENKDLYDNYCTDNTVKKFENKIINMIKYVQKYQTFK